jgi:glutamine amidotransferase-like uncharacterized protein
MKIKLMKKLAAGFLVLSIVWGQLSAIAPELGGKQAQAIDEVKPIALVYRGPIIGCDGCSEAVGTLLNNYPGWDFDVRYVGPNESLSVQNGLKLPNVFLYAQPGGDGDLDSAYNLVSSNATAIRTFVQNGGGYIVDNDPGYGLGLDTNQYITSRGATVRTDTDSMVQVSWRGVNRWMYLQDGPYFIPKTGVAGQTILAKYTNNLVAAMVQPFGSGKIGVSGPHPEADASWYAEAGLTDQDGLDASLGYDLLDTLMAGAQPPVLSSAKSILSFSLAGRTGVINETNRTVALSLPAGTNVSWLAPTITVSAKATVSPASGGSVDFTNPITYTVTTENGTTQTYNVTATVETPILSSAKAITSLSLAGKVGVINETNHTVAIGLSYGTSVTALAPTITVSDKATISPASGGLMDFTNPVVYTVTAENGSTQSYIVTVTVASAVRPIALVYRGPVVGCTGCSEAVAALLDSDTTYDFDIRYVGPFESTSVQAGLKLPNAVLYAQPGGDGSLSQAYRKVKNDAAAIRTFVQNGGRYLGICMGGYFVDNDPGYALGLDTDQFITSPGASVKTASDSLVQISWRGVNRWMYLQDGPYFIPKTGVAGQTILAKYTNNLVAAMVQPFGNGKIGVSGPHPEANDLWYKQARLTDSDGLDADLGHHLVDTLME